MYSRYKNNTVNLRIRDQWVWSVGVARSPHRNSCTSGTGVYRARGQRSGVRVGGGDQLGEGAINAGLEVCVGDHQHALLVPRVQQHIVCRPCVQLGEAGQ